MSSDSSASRAAVDSVDKRDEPNTPNRWLTAGPPRRRWIVPVCLVAYGLFLVSLPHIVRTIGEVSGTSIWSLQDSQQFLLWLKWIAWAALGDVLRFIPLGFLAARSFSNDAPSSPRPRGVWKVLAKGCSLAAVVAVLVHMVDVVPGRGHVLVLAPLILPFAGCLLGAWFGANWVRAWHGQLRLLLHVLVLVSVAGLTGIVMVCLAVDDKPLGFEPAVVSSEDKRQLIKLFQDKDPRDVNPGAVQTLSLSSAEVNRLLAWGLSVGSRDRKAVVKFGQDRAELHCSLGLPLAAGNRRYLNLTAIGQVEVDSGRVVLRNPHLRVGRLTVPGWLLRLLSSVVLAKADDDRHAKHLLDAIQRIEIDSDRVTVRYGRIELPPGFVSDVFDRLGPRHDSLPTIRIYVQHLLAAQERLVGREDRFAACVEEAFRLARERSRRASPVLENRAAIFGLAILLGHWRVQTLVGKAIDDDVPPEALGVFRSVPLRGRGDWTKHFWVSAALALLSNQVTSDATGLLKEELDAGHGGSGFSFSDLLADRAGTTFALTATRNELAARAIQDRLARGFVVDDFFPPAGDLPEGISDAELTRLYGGVNGPGYTRLVQEIERRIAECSAYR